MMFTDAVLRGLEGDLRAARHHWGFGDGTAVALLAVSENATFLLSEGGLSQEVLSQQGLSQQERRVVVRVSRPGYHDDDEVRSELAWVDALDGAGIVPVGRPLRTVDGRRMVGLGRAERFRAVGFRHVAGCQPAVNRDLPGWFRRLGGITARLHGHARRWAPPAGFRRKVWDFEAILGSSALWGDWRRAPGLDGPGRAVLERVHRRLAAETAAVGRDAGRFGLVHCDLRLTNLLVEGDRMSVIDFDDCGFCWYAYDFAAAVSFIEHDPILPRLRDAWVEGYREVAAFPDDQARALPVFVMLRRMQLLAWIASHAESPTAAAMGAGFARDTVALGRDYLGEGSALP